MEMDDSSAARAISREYTLRLRNALGHSRRAKEVLTNSKLSHALTAEQREDLLWEVNNAERMAVRGFRYDQICDFVGDPISPHSTTIMGAWVAAEAIIIKHEVEGMKFMCATVPGCGCERLCAMNNLIDRKIEDGYKPSTPVELHLPVPYQAMADGCPKNGEPSVIREDDPRMATCARWTEDTASFGRVR